MQENKPMSKEALDSKSFSALGVQVAKAPRSSIPLHIGETHRIGQPIDQPNKMG